jgi:hypothetical protein
MMASDAARWILLHPGGGGVEEQSRVQVSCAKQEPHNSKPPISQQAEDTAFRSV